jgi:putative ABC transport system permease protein
MRRPDLDDFEREMRDHVEEDTQENLARGMAPDEARAAAIRKFGNPVRVKEDVRAVWVPRWADQIGQDVRDAARRLRRHPGFALVIVATLALGIALPTAIYSVVNAVLLRPLSYAHPDRLVWPTTRSERDANRGGPASAVEILNEIDFYTWQQESVSFDHLVAYIQGDSTIAGDGEALRVRVLSASEGFWDISGGRAVAGVLPSPADREALVVSHRLFVERFGSDPSVIGRAISLDGQQMTITAVLAPDFNPQLPAMRFGAALSGRIEPDVFRGMRINPPPRTRDQKTQIRILQAIGQLKEGVTIEQARAELNTVHKRAQQLAAPFGLSTVLLTPLHERLVGASRRALTLLLAAGFCVLLITCANVANLLLSRSAARQKEIALRMSVGGGPLRVIRQLLAESIAYALIGGAAGVLLATWLLSVVVSVIGPAVPRLLETTVDLRVLGFALAVSLGTALVFGMGPAINLACTSAQDVLKEGTRTSSVARPRRITGRVMIAMQLALTVVLLTGAGLMLKSIWRMTSYPDGFSPDEILTLRVDFRGPAYRQRESRQQLGQSLLARAEALPGVREAAITTLGESMMLLIKEGEKGPPENRESRATPVNTISPGFPRTMGMKVVHGRGFEDIEPVPVVLINEALAARDYAGADPIGQRIRLPWLGEDVLGTIAGVVSNMKYTRIDADMKPEVFFHTAQTELFGVTLVLRIDGDPIAAAPTVRNALASVDPTQSIFAVQTMEQTLAESIAPRRFNVLLLGTFAFVAAFLAVLGVYGVVAHAVAERTHEIGIRLALGAERRRVVGMIVSEAMLSVVAGVAIGTAAAVGATSLIADLLYGIEARDPQTFVAATLVLTAIAFVACAAPALRAAVVDPAVALRSE